MKYYFWTLIFFLACLEIYSILPVRNPVSETRVGPPFLRGIIHVHSRYSDGSGTVPEIARAAEENQIDFVVLTDHNSTEARRNGEEKRYGKTDLFVEIEASTPAGHALVFYSHTSHRDLADRDVGNVGFQHFLGQNAGRDFFLIAAHPSNVKNPWNRLDKFPDGLEAINFDSVWQRLLSDSVIQFSLTAALYPLNAYLAALRMVDFYPKDLVSWDNMNSFSPGHFAILAQDTHARIQLGSRFSLAWPSYQESFRLAQNVVFVPELLSEDFFTRKRQIYESIREGKSAMHFRSVYPFEGNEWKMQCPDATYWSGDTASSERSRCEFVVKTPASLPYRTTIRLYRDGEVIAEKPATGPATAFALKGPGAYRVEVRARMRSLLGLVLNRDVPYVFYNPIYVR